MILQVATMNISNPTLPKTNSKKPLKINQLVQMNQGFPYFWWIFGRKLPLISRRKKQLHQQTSQKFDLNLHPRPQSNVKFLSFMNWLLCGFGFIYVSCSKHTSGFSLFSVIYFSPHVLNEVLFLNSNSRIWGDSNVTCWWWFGFQKNLLGPLFFNMKKARWLVVLDIFYFHPYLGKIPILASIFFKGVGSTTN